MHTEEKKTKKKSISPVQKTARVLLKVILFLLLFVVVVFLLILTPPVQRFLTNKTEDFLQNKLKTEVEIGGISFGLSGNISLRDIYIEDQTKDTLISGELMKANINIPKLFNNELEIKNIGFKNITAKVKRLLPDTAFNFQFIVDAFATQTTTPVDTTTAPLELDISDVELDNVRFIYNDVVTGNDVTAYIDALNAELDTTDTYNQRYSIPLIDARGVTAIIKQTKPLVTPEPVSQDVQEAAQAPIINIDFGEIDLRRLKLQYANDVSAFYTNLDLGRLTTTGKSIDLPNRKLHFENLALNNSVVDIRLGNTSEAKVVEEEIEKEVATQVQFPWNFRVDNIQLNNNQIEFDNDNEPELAHGMDYAHMNINNLTLHVEDLVVKSDSMGATVTKGNFSEKSGFQLDALEGSFLYANNQSYIKDFYLKTPGTELKREVLMQYASYEAFAKQPEKTTLEVDIPDSYIQVKDILTFAPQLRSQPAFSNPSDVWHLNLRASGNMDRLHIAALQFDGFGNTQIDASGTLASLTNPNAAGGTLTIRRFHTTQSDIELLSGQQLDNQLNLPQSIDVRGTLSGNMSNLNTDLAIATSAGNLDVDGRFTNLTNPDAATYNATVRTSGLQIGSIMRNPQLGSLSATITANGRGFTPEAIHTNFKGNIYSFGYNNYTYRNISVNGSMRNNVFDVQANAEDPNADFNLAAQGNLSTQSFSVHGFVDSLKTLPLNLTTQPLIFRGKIDAEIPVVSEDYIKADVLITNSLFVSGTDRLPLDTLHLVSGRTDTGQFIRLHSDIANAGIHGQYRIADLGNIIQDNIAPYFSAIAYKKSTTVQPYDFSFNASVQYHPIYSAFVPGLKDAEALRAEGHLASGEGMEANLTTSYILYGTNQIHNLNVDIHTEDSGMYINGTVDRLRSGNSLDLYNTRLNAVAFNNNLDFDLRVGDKADKDKYLLSGLVTQPSTGDIRISLNQDTLMLNYERWNIAPNNSISVINNNIYANDFILSHGNQQLSLQSRGTTGDQPLDVAFNNFHLSTITGFIKSDSTLVDGTMNGTVSLQNVMTQPVFTSDLAIADLSFRQDTIGNVNLNVASAGNRYNTNLTITGRGNDVALTGSFAPTDNNDIALDLAMTIGQLKLNTLKGAMAGFVTQASGGISGNVSINGTTSSPKVLGTLNFDTTSLTTAMLGGPFTIDDEQLRVTENGFVFNNFAIRDSANNAMTLNGSIATSNFINYNFSLDVDADNFKAVSSTQKDNKLFFGDLVLSANLHVGGNEEKPIVDGSVTVTDGTQFSIVLPQAQPGVADREGVVEFVDFDAPENDSLFLTAYDSLNVTDITGLELSTNIIIEKEAIFNIIVDVANGDFLNLRGAAQLSAGIDPSGAISLTGSYEIEEGAYQLSFNFLQRRFEIEKGSRIVWLGEPTNAEVDVTAVYIANAAPLDLVEQMAGESIRTERNLYLQKLPFHVYLMLDGELMKPEISFDIRLPQDRNYNVGGTVLPTVRTRLAQMRQEPSELNKQVFAVLLLNRFVGTNPFESSGDGFDAGTFARQSVSKLLTEQLNNLAAGLISGVDINFDVTSSDDYTTGDKRSRTDLNVGLSKRLLNDRLTVTVGSNFQLEGPQQTNQASNNIAGNVSVNYQLSKDGRYMLRFYRRNEYEGTVDGYIIETGLGFIMNINYDHISEIFGKKKKAEETADNNQNQQQ